MVVDSCYKCQMLTGRRQTGGQPELEGREGGGIWDVENAQKMKKVFFRID